MRKYPTMKKAIELNDGAEVEVNATIDVFTGKPLVVLSTEEVACDRIPDVNFTPAEAERFGRILIKAAAVARAKIAYARKVRAVTTRDRVRLEEGR